MVWWAFPIAETVSLLLCLYFKQRTMKAINAELAQRAAASSLAANNIA